MKAKKKPRRRSDSSGGYTLSDIIQSPPAAGKLRHTMDRLPRSMFFISATMFYASQSFSPRACQAPRCFGNWWRAIILLTDFFFLLPVISPSLVKSDKVNSAESLQELLTSDSEGSCMGVSSPRDMQSPVFHDRVEVNDCVSPPYLEILCHKKFVFLIIGWREVNLYVAGRLTRLGRSWRLRLARPPPWETHSPLPPILLQGPFPKFLQGATHSLVHQNICNLTLFSHLASLFRKCCQCSEKKCSIHPLIFCGQQWFIHLDIWTLWWFNMQCSSSTPSLGSKNNHGHGGRLSANP